MLVKALTFKVMLASDDKNILREAVKQLQAFVGQWEAISDELQNAEDSDLAMAAMTQNSCLLEMTEDEFYESVMNEAAEMQKPKVAAES